MKIINNVIDHFSKRNDDWLRLAKTINPSKASDLLQEAYLKLYRRFEEQGKGYILINDKTDYGYMYLTLQSINTDYYRSNYHHQELNEELLTTDEEEDEIDIKQKWEDLTDKMKEVVESWDYFNRELFKLYITSGKSMRTLEDELNIKYYTIFHCIRECKEYLKEELGEDYNKYFKNY